MTCILLSESRRFDNRIEKVAVLEEELVHVRMYALRLGEICPENEGSRAEAKQAERSH